MSARAGGLALGFAAGWNIANTGAAAAPLHDAYGVALPTVGLLTTALFVTHFAAQLPGGALVDRFGARRVGLGALGFVLAGNALALAAASFPLALGARLVAGVGTGAGFVAGSDWLRAAWRSPAGQGVFGGLSVGGGGVAIAAVPLLEPALGWRSPYLTALAVAVAAAPLLLAQRPPTGPTAGRPDLRRVVGDRALYPLAALHTASFGVSVIVGNWIVSRLEHEGMSSGAAGAIGAATLLGGLVTRPLGGLALQRRPGSARRVLAASVVVGAAAVAVLATSAPAAALALAATAAGLAAGAPFAAAFAGAQRLRPAAPAAAIALVNSAATFTILAGTPLVGLTFDLPGDGRIGFAALALLWAAALPAVPRAAAALTDSQTRR